MIFSKIKCVIKKIIIVFFGKYIPVSFNCKSADFQQIDEISHKARLENYKKFKGKNNKIAFFTAITGDYEDFKLPEFFDLDIDYYVFTDSEELVVYEPFSKILLDKFESDATRLARWVKLNPQKVFSNYDYVVWVDSNLLVKGSLLNYVSLVEKSNSDIGFFKHPERTTLREEIDACKKLSKDSHKDIDRQYSSYVDQFGESEINAIPLVESNVYVASVRKDATISFFSDWFYELFTYSKRDQISLPIAMLKNIDLKVFYLEGSRQMIPRFNKNLFEIFRHVDRRSYVTPSYFKAISSSPSSIMEKSCVSKRAGSTVTIIVPVYNALEEIKQLSVSLLSQTDRDFELIFIDDASENDTNEFLIDFCKRYDFSLIVHEKNKGYTQTVNDGVLSAKNDLIIVLNSDTILPDCFVSTIKKYEREYPYISAFGPVTNAGSWQNIPKLRDINGKIAINSLPKNCSVNVFNEKLVNILSDLNLVKVNLLNGFCYAVRRSVYEEIGVLDKENFPTGYGEEDDFFIRLNQHGFQAGIMTSLYVFHHKTKSFTSEQKIKYSKAGLNTLYQKYSKSLVTRLVKNSSENPMLKDNRELVDTKIY